MASGIRRVRGRNGLRARDAAHGHMAVVAVIFVWTVFIVVVHVHVVLLVVLVVLVVLVGAARLRLLLRLLQLFDFLSQFCSVRACIGSYARFSFGAAAVAGPGGPGSDHCSPEAQV